MLEDGALELRLPHAPSTNDYKIPVRKRPGVYYLTRRAQRFRADVTWICSGAPRFGDKLVTVEVVLHPPDARARDSDNNLKAIFDALEAGCIIVNDVQIMEHKVAKGVIVKGGLVIVTVREWLGALLEYRPAQLQCRTTNWATRGNPAPA